MSHGLTSGLVVVVVVDSVILVVVVVVIVLDVIVVTTESIIYRSRKATLGLSAPMFLTGYNLP